jgi:hypothetical protein
MSRRWRDGDEPAIEGGGDGLARSLGLGDGETRGGARWLGEEEDASD